MSLDNPFTGLSDSIAGTGLIKIHISFVWRRFWRKICYRFWVFFWYCRHGSSNCLGCCNKPPPITLVDDPSKGLKTQGNQVNNPIISEGFWTTSTCDMDNSAVQSQGSISSISTTNQILDANGAIGSINIPSEFVNHGLFFWNQTRQRWAGNKKFENRPQEVWEPKLNFNATYASLLGSNKPFPEPIPLSEMVDFLVNVWEKEGMYD